MKLRLLLASLLCSCAAHLASAKDIVTLSGSTYRNVTEMQARGTNLWFLFDSRTGRGHGMIQYSNLPSTLRAKYFPEQLVASSSVTKSGPLAPIAASHIGMEAEMFQNSAKARDYFKTDYGSSDLHTEKSRAIGARVRNFGSEPAPAVLTVHWIGKHTGTNVRVLLKTETRKLSIAPGAATTVVSDSGDVKGSDLNLVMIGYRRTSGERIEGWTVMLHDASGALIGVKASDTPLADLVRREGGLGELQAASKAAMK